MSRFSTSLRLLVAGLIAAVLVFAGAGWLVQHVANERSTRAASEAVAGSIHAVGTFFTGPSTSATPEKAGQPRVVPASVRVAFTVDRHGRARNIRVLSAAPPGTYAAKARAVIAARRFKPSQTAREAAAERIRVLQFGLPVKASPKNTRKSPAPGSAG